MHYQCLTHILLMMSLFSSHMSALDIKAGSYQTQYHGSPEPHLSPNSFLTPDIINGWTNTFIQLSRTEFVSPAPEHSSEEGSSREDQSSITYTWLMNKFLS